MNTTRPITPTDGDTNMMDGDTDGDTNINTMDGDTSTTMMERETKKTRKVNWSTWSLTSQKQSFEVELPNTHMLITKTEFSKLKQAQEQVKRVQQGFNKKRFTKMASPLMKGVLAIALASVPGLGLHSAAYFIPLVVHAFLVDHGVINTEDDDTLELFASSFPSHAFMRENLVDMATMNTMALGEELKG